MVNFGKLENYFSPLAHDVTPVPGMQSITTLHTGQHARWFDGYH